MIDSLTFRIVYTALFILLFWYAPSAHAQFSSGGYGVVVDEHGQIYVSGTYGLGGGGQEYFVVGSDSLSKPAYYYWTAKYTFSGQSQWLLTGGHEVIGGGGALSSGGDVYLIRQVSTRINSPTSIEVARVGSDGYSTSLLELPSENAYRTGFGISVRGSAICATAATEFSGYNPDYWSHRISSLYRALTDGGYLWKWDVKTAAIGRGRPTLLTAADTEGGCYGAVASIAPFSIGDVEYSDAKEGSLLLTSTSAEGDLDWTKTVGEGHLHLGAMQADSEDNVYLLVDVLGSASFSGSAGRIDVGRTNERTQSLLKYSKDGVLLWLREMVPGDNAMINSFAVAEDGNVYLVGSSAASEVLFRDNDVAIELEQASGVYAFIAKFDSSGNLLAAKKVATSAESSVFGLMARGITTDADGYLFVTGGYYGSPTFGRQPNELSVAGSGPMFLAKYDPFLDLVWAAASAEYVGVRSLPDASEAGTITVFPNPFREAARCIVTVENDQYAELVIVNALGQKVHTIHRGRFDSRSEHEFSIDGIGLTPGVYLIRFAGERTSLAGTAVRLM